jgi:hypothetical protein
MEIMGIDVRFDGERRVAHVSALLDEPGESEERWVRIVGETLRRIPAGAVTRWVWPRIGVTLMGAPLLSSATAWARSSPGGNVEVAPKAAGLGDEALVDLLAHEFAHFTVYSKGGEIRDESAAEALAEAWGFPLSRLRAACGSGPCE